MKWNFKNWTRGIIFKCALFTNPTKSLQNVLGLAEKRHLIAPNLWRIVQKGLVLFCWNPWDVQLTPMADHVTHDHCRMDVRGLTDVRRNFTGKTVVVEGGSGSSIPFTSIASAVASLYLVSSSVENRMQPERKVTSKYWTLTFRELKGMPLKKRKNIQMSCHLSLLNVVSSIINHPQLGFTIDCIPSNGMIL